MTEARALSLVATHPHPRALARHMTAGSQFPALRRLEAAGLVRRVGGGYRVTQRGRNELELIHALGRLLARTP